MKSIPGRTRQARLDFGSLEDRAMLSPVFGSFGPPQPPPIMIVHPSHNGMDRIGREFSSRGFSDTQRLDIPPFPAVAFGNPFLRGARVEHLVRPDMGPPTGEPATHISSLNLNAGSSNPGDVASSAVNRAPLSALFAPIAITLLRDLPPRNEPESLPPISLNLTPALPRLVDAFMVNRSEGQSIDVPSSSSTATRGPISPAQSELAARSIGIGIGKKIIKLTPVEFSNSQQLETGGSEPSSVADAVARSTSQVIIREVAKHVLPSPVTAELLFGEMSLDRTTLERTVDQVLELITDLDEPAESDATVSTMDILPIAAGLLGAESIRRWRRRRSLGRPHYAHSPLSGLC
jgi:hypothetical protein